MLSIMAPESKASPSVASSSSMPIQLAVSGTQAAASSAASSLHTPPSESDSLSQYWRPCTADETIGSCLEALQFPVSYRDLVYSWEEAGSPALRSLRVPLGVHRPTSSTELSRHTSMDLHTITELQERAVIVAIEDYFRRGGIVSQSRAFVHFASHLDIYTSVYVEMMATQHNWSMHDQTSAYERTWRSLLDAFHHDRSKCTKHDSHDCLYQLLWGEVAAWPISEIKRCFKAYKMRSTSAKSRSAISMPASPVSSRHFLSASAQAWSEGVEGSHTPYLSSSASSSCASRSGSVRDVGQSPSSNESASPLGSPLASLQTSAPYDALLSGSKPWPESSVMLQALTGLSSDPSRTADSNQPFKRRHSRSLSYPAPIQVSQLQGGLVASQSDGSLNASAAGTPRSDDAFTLTTQYVHEPQSVQMQWSAPGSVAQEYSQDDPTGMWMQHHRLLLQDAAAQLELAAQLLNAKASRLRGCTVDQEQWGLSQIDAFPRPTMRRHHTHSPTTH